jgi:hypothetical protein
MCRIALVVDECFGSKVLELARTMYVWLIESDENDQWAKLAWTAPQQNDDPLLYGVTTFKRQQGEDLDSMIIRLIDMIDEHHGEFAHDPEWSEIDVVGACLSSAIEVAAADYDVDRCEVVASGFRLCRRIPKLESDDHASGRSSRS